MLHIKEIVLCSTILLLWTVAPAEPRVANELSAEIENEYDIEETDTEAVSHAVINQAVNACHLDRYMRLDCIGLCIYNVPQVLELEGVGCSLCKIVGEYVRAVALTESVKVYLNDYNLHEYELSIDTNFYTNIAELR